MFCDNLRTLLDHYSEWCLCHDITCFCICLPLILPNFLNFCLFFHRKPDLHTEYFYKKGMAQWVRQFGENKKSFSYSHLNMCWPLKLVDPPKSLKPLNNPVWIGKINLLDMSLISRPSKKSQEAMTKKTQELGPSIYFLFYSHRFFFFPIQCEVVMVSNIKQVV